MALKYACIHLLSIEHMRRLQLELKATLLFFSPRRRKHNVHFTELLFVKTFDQVIVSPNFWRAPCKCHKKWEFAGDIARKHWDRLPRLLFRIQYDFDLTSPYFIYAFWGRSLNNVRDTLMIDAVEFAAILQIYNCSLAPWKSSRITYRDYQLYGEIKGGFVLV